MRCSRPFLAACFTSRGVCVLVPASAGGKTLVFSAVPERWFDVGEEAEMTPGRQDKDQCGPGTPDAFLSLPEEQPWGRNS